MRKVSLLMSTRVKFAPVEGAAALFTPAFCEYLTRLHEHLDARAHDLRQRRVAVLERALRQHVLPAHPPASEATVGAWRVPPMPDELKKPGIEISGPCSITSMFINALHPGPEGGGPRRDPDGDGGSGGHRLIRHVRSAHNRLAGVNREVMFVDPQRNPTYAIADGELPFFMHRERGLHLDEPDVTVDGKPVNAALLGTALTLFYAGRAQAGRGQGIYFYLPKLEAAAEARWYRDLFDLSQTHLPFLGEATIRAIVLVESLPCVYEMEEMLYELGPYAAGLNAARWDLKASIFEFVMTDPDQVWPDRFGVDIKTTPFLANVFRRLVAICLKRGAVPIGGMATALPSPDPDINRAAAEAIRADKQWEAEQGFIRGWVAHIFHMKTAGDPFKKLIGSGWKPTAQMADPDNYPVAIKVPEGPVTVEGTRRNARMLIEYVEGWLGGRGAKGIDSLEGKPGIHPALMEDLATGRMSVAQIAQRILHRARETGTGAEHDYALVKRLLDEELADILARRQGAETHERYRKARKIAMRWIKNYTELNFKSLGAYTPAELDAIAAAPDAF